MDRKQIDICFGEIPTLLLLNEMSKYQKIEKNKKSDKTKESFFNPFFESDELQNLNLVSINFKETFSSLKNGISFKQ